ncbi:tetratricopeptide repeat protein [Patescibacteria group bacterium]|nr:tetratricopeptide repeat protein [Patescibacteria group bacterium]MBU1728015.1 tetratricopeptide repeat protein [Patescibacteria group bacterium]
MLSNILDRISFWSLFSVIVLLPVFFLPFTKIPTENSKGLLLIVGLAISIIFWTAARFSDGKIILPKSWLLVAGLGIILSSLLSAFFSSAPQFSFFGIMFDTGTFYFLLAAFLLMAMSSIVFKDAQKAKIVLKGIIISSAVLFVFQIFHIFMPTISSLGLLAGKIDNLLGSWNALGIFAGFSVVVSLFVFVFFTISKREKMFLGILTILSVVLIAIVNLSLVWWMLGFFALFIFVYKISLNAKQAEESKRVFPILPFSVIMISLLFIMLGQFIGGFLPNRLGVSNFEIRPSFSSTMSVAKDALAKNPILGLGPNRFSEAWDMHKPLVINSTNFWDTSFNFGSGFLPTFVVTNGSLGLLAWVIFFAVVLIVGLRSLFVTKKKNVLNTKANLFFVASIYLFVSSFVYPVGATLFLLAFAFLGIFIGLYCASKSKGEISLSLLDDPRKSFFSILLLVAVMIITVSAGFKYAQRFASTFYFQKVFSAETIPDAELFISKAVALHPNDLYFRTYSEVYMAKMNSLIAKGSSITDSEKIELQMSFDQAVRGSQSAIAYNSKNYLNFKMLGLIYDVVGMFGAEGAYNNAIEAYKSASELNPVNPGLKINLAKSSFSAGKIQEAKDYAKQALSLKGDYVDALIILSQISKIEGKNTDALSYAEAALYVFPQDQGLAQYVDALKNNSKEVENN